MDAHLAAAEPAVELLSALERKPTNARGRQLAGNVCRQRRDGPAHPIAQAELEPEAPRVENGGCEQGEVRIVIAARHAALGLPHHPVKAGLGVGVEPRGNLGGRGAIVDGEQGVESHEPSCGGWRHAGSQRLETRDAVAREPRAAATTALIRRASQTTRRPKAGLASHPQAPCQAPRKRQLCNF